MAKWLAGERSRHLILKWSPEAQPDTIELHREVQAMHGSVWWANFSSRKTKGISPETMKSFISQIERNESTFAILKGGHRFTLARVIDLALDETSVSEEPVPDYYPASATHNLWIRMSILEDLDPESVESSVLLASNPDSPIKGALGNQTSPLIVLVSDSLVERHFTPEDIEVTFEREVARLEGLPLNELKRLALSSDARPKKREGVSNTYVRNSAVAAYALARAAGECDLCGAPAPFVKRNGDPFLESHHVVWLSKGGADTPANVVAVCPNCHRKLHVLGLDRDVAVLVNLNETR